MTSREKVMASVNHRDPGSVAVDLGATPSSGISAMAYNRLSQYMGLDVGPAKIYDVVQQLAQIDDKVIDALGIDVIDIGRAFNNKESDWKEFLLPDGSIGLIPQWFHPERQADGSYRAYKDGRYVANMPGGAAFFDQTYFHYADEMPETFDDIDEAMKYVLWQAFAHSPWDHADDDRFWEDLREKTIALSQSSDKALMITCGCNLFEWGTFLRRIDNFLCDIMIDEEKVEAMLDALMQRHLRTLEKVCRSVGDIVDILRFGDDLGMDSGPFMQPDIYRNIFKPKHTALCDYVHKHSGMKTFLHSCGSIYKLMPDLIDAGYDIINPVQITAKDMEPETLKKEFGQRITFWGGGCDTRAILNRGTTAEVKDHVRRLIEIFAPGGGFVFNQIHNILSDVPPENIIAMYEAVNEYR